jgi:S-adenosylmethionine uptake transporter
MLGASLLFATMGVCVKLAAETYPAGEIVFYRGLVGMLFTWLLSRSRGSSLRTDLPAMHFWRSLCGVLSLGLWFYALSGLPLATAVTLNYLSSVWMALFLLGSAALLGSAPVDGRLIAAVLSGFGGVALVLRPTLTQDQLWFGLAGLLSGMTAALAYLQVTALGQRGEPETRIVFCFALGGVVAGALSMLWTGYSSHSWRGAGLLLAVGLLASAAQLMITRAFAIAVDAVECRAAILRHPLRRVLWRAAVRRALVLDDDCRHAADRRLGVHGVRLRAKCRQYVFGRLTCQASAA